MHAKEADRKTTASSKIETALDLVPRLFSAVAIARPTCTSQTEPAYIDPRNRKGRKSYFASSIAEFLGSMRAVTWGTILRSRGGRPRPTGGDSLAFAFAAAKEAKASKSGANQTLIRSGMASAMAHSALSARLRCRPGRANLGSKKTVSNPDWRHGCNGRIERTTGGGH
jgi:hypothetical protein